MAFILIALLALSAYFYYHFYYKRLGLPPGPTPLPLAGNMLTVLRDPPGEGPYRQWKDQYGDVYTYWMGHLPVVAVTDLDTIYETFQKDGETYAGRYPFKDFDDMCRGGQYGVIFTEGDLWREQRRFALHVLRDFGLGKNVMQDRILDEISTIFEKIERDLEAGKPEHNLNDDIDLAVGSIINVLLFNYRFHGDKEAEFYDLKHRVETFITTTGHPIVMLAIPNPYFYQYVPYVRGKLMKAVHSGNYLLDFFRKRIRDHERDFVDGEPINDYVQAFLQEKLKKEQSDEKHYFTNDQLTAMCFDLWIAGQETTSNTLAWGWAYLSYNPEVQDKCAEELRRVLGCDRIVTVADKADLPYCNAVVNEVQRIANLVPQNVWHKTTKDVTIKGYFIPKGTAILPQISVVLSHDDVFPEPKQFKPERFLDENGKLKRADELIPFSLGKRQCLGEGLARMELFLFLVNIINRYKILPGAKKPNLTRRMGGAVHIDPFTCVFERRS